MGRKSKDKKDRAADPARAERIRTMLEKEQALRDTLERTQRLGKDLSDRMHYDRLFKDKAARVPKLSEEIAHDLREAIELLGKAFVARQHLSRECDDLQAELDVHQGRPPKPDLMTTIDPFLQTLPREQADAFRLIVELERGRRGSAQEAKDRVEKTSAALDSLDTKVAIFRQEVAESVLIAEEKVRRGWMPQSAFDSARAALEKPVRDGEASILALRELVRDYAKDYDSFTQRMQEIQTALAERDAS